MTISKRALLPERLRTVPAHFSWLDHRLVREHFIERAEVDAWALYLFLVTVADAHGVSYYADATLGLQVSNLGAVERASHMTLDPGHPPDHGTAVLPREAGPVTGVGAHGRVPVR